MPTLLKEQRAFTSSVVTETRKRVKDAPVSSSNIGKRYFKKNWKELAKAKRDPNAPKKEKKPKAAEAAAEGQAAVQLSQTIQKYDREEQRKNAKKRKQVADDDGIRPGDFLFHYARFNLGEQALTKPISLHIREAMWQLYDADCVSILISFINLLYKYNIPILSTKNKINCVIRTFGHQQDLEPNLDFPLRLQQEYLNRTPFHLIIIYLVIIFILLLFIKLSFKLYFLVKLCDRVKVILMKAYEKYLERRHERKLRKFHAQQEAERLACIRDKKISFHT